MKDKVVFYLQALTSKQQNRFSDFLNSPYFNNREKIVVLFEYIRKKTLKQPEGIFDETGAFQAVYGKETFSPNKIRKLKAALLELLLKFLSLLSWEKSKEEAGLHLLKSLNTLGDTTYFEHYHKKVKDQIEKSREKDDRTFSTLLSVENERFRYQQKKGTAGNTSFLENIFTSLEADVATKLFKQGMGALNHELITGQSSLPEWMSSVFENSFFDSFEGSSLPRIYYYLYKTLKEPDNLESLLELRNMLPTAVSDLSAQEASEVYTACLNNFYRQSVITGKERQSYLLELYLLMYEDLFVERGMVFSPFHFRNMVSLGALLKRFDWLASFMQTAIPLLSGDENDRLIAETFNQGVLFFHQSKYEEAESLFNKVLPLTNEVFYETNSRAYLLMVHYETENTLGMESLVHSFRMYITRTKDLSERHREKRLEFVRLFRRLISVPPRDSDKIQKLRIEVGAADLSPIKTWIMEKLDQLANK